MKKTLSFYLMIILIAVFGLLNFSALSLWSSPSQYFNTTTTAYYLNWTNVYVTNVTITANNTYSVNFTVEVLNSTALAENYSQYNYITGCPPTLTIANATGYGELAGPLNGSASYNSANISFITNSYCNPGRYLTTQLMIRNYTNSTENLKLTAVLDVPISINNSLTGSSGVANFGGTTAKMPTNAIFYHSYWFNATSSAGSEIANVTTVTINLTGWSSSQDVDLFLFDGSGNLLTKSMGTESYEWLTYSYLPTSAQIYEIRVYGNTTSTSGASYNGYLIFGSLSANNASNGQTISSINFGNSMNAADTSTVNFFLNNTGNLSLTSVAESKELALVKKFVNSGSKNITFLVPNSSIASKVKVALNWTGASNYTFTVVKPDGTTVMTGNKNYLSGNKTNAVQEIFSETTSIGSTPGYWRVDIKNNTAQNDQYNLTTYVYVNSSAWISSNYTTSSFSQFNKSLVQLNLTVPNDTLDGTYEGFLRYNAATGAALRIPVSVTTKTGLLVVNKSIEQSTVQINEDIGVNLTKVLNITINNTGSYGLTISPTSSNNMLNLTGEKYMTFTYDYPTTLAANSDGVFNITVTINTNQTSNEQGIYRGWIIFSTNGSHPYQNFTLNLNVNLTNYLDYSINNFTAANGSTMTASNVAENATLKFDLTYLNGSSLEYPTSMNLSNFTFAWLMGTNVSYRIPTTGNVTISNGTNPIYSGGLYGLNFSIPADQPGGYYEAHVIASYTRNPTYSVEINSGTFNKYLIIRTTGLFMSSNASGCSFGSSCASSISLDPGNSTKIYVNVSNFGPVTSAGTTTNNITLSGDTNCLGWEVTAGPTYSSCPSDSFVPVGNSTTCIVSWTITANTSQSGAGGCTAYITGKGYWYNPDGVNVSISVNNLTSSSTNTTGGTTTTTGNYSVVAANYLNITTYPSIVYVTQGKTNSSSVIVKNTNATKTQDISLKVEDITSSWSSVSPSLSTVSALHNITFTVTFSIPNNTEVKDYSARFSALSNYANISRSFTLRVMPGEEKKTEINISVASYKLTYGNFSQEVSQLKAQGYNTTDAEAKLSVLKSKLEQADLFISRGDYFSANNILNDIKTLVSDIANEIQKIRQSKPVGASWTNWVLVGVGVSVGGLLLYLFWPTEIKFKLPSLPSIPKPAILGPQKYEFKQKKEIVIKTAEQAEENPWDKLREKWEEIKKRV